MRIMGETIRSPELADILVEGLTNGTPLRQLCRENGVSKSAVYDWLDDDDALAGRIARARTRGAHEIAESCLEISDDKEEEAASRKVRIWTRLELLKKWNPREYGDKQTTVHEDPNGNNPFASLMDAVTAGGRPRPGGD